MLHTITFVRRSFPNASSAVVSAIAIALAALLGTGIGLLMAR
jgi:hypothetical protein